MTLIRPVTLTRRRDLTGFENLSGLALELFANSLKVDVRNFYH